MLDSLLVDNYFKESHFNTSWTRYVCNSVDIDLKRVHLLSRKNIGNIEKSYHLNTKQIDKNDPTSVDCWVKERME